MRKGAFVESIDRLLVWERDGGVCGICGKVISGNFTIDHIIPLSRGGKHCYENVQIAHGKCNNQKGSLLPWEITLKGRPPNRHSKGFINRRTAPSLRVAGT